MRKSDKPFLFPSLNKIKEFVFYLFFLFLPSQFGKHFWLEESLQKGLRVDYFALKIYFLDVTVILLLFLLLIDHRIKKPNLKKLTPILLVFIQVFWSQTPIVHLFFSLRISFSTLLVFLIAKNLSFSKKTINKIILIQSIFLSTTSIFQIILQKNIGGLFYFLGERSFSIQTPAISLFSFLGKNYLRPYSTFSHPNALAGYCLVLFFFTKFFNKNKTQSLLAQFFLGITIFLSFSQNAWFFFISTFSLFHLIKKQKISKKCTVKLIFLSFLIPFLLLLLEKVGDFSQEFTIRNILFSQSLKNWRFLLFGGSWFFDIFNLMRNGVLIENRAFFQPIHHSWWLILFSIGILPLMVLKKHFKTKRFNKEWFLLFFSIITTGSFDHYWITQIQNFYLITFLIIYFQNYKN